jgi:hypothetical protein
VRELLLAKAVLDIHTVSEDDGSTVLHGAAAMAGNGDTVRLLRESHASVNALDHQDRTPLSRRRCTLCGSCCGQRRQLMVAARPRSWPQCNTAKPVLSRHPVATVRRLLQAKASVRAVDQQKK